MYWIIGRKSKLSPENKLLIYKTILKPIWTYGIPLWGTAGNSNIEILQRFQNKVLRSIVNAPWYVPNTILHTDLQIPTVKAEITNFSTKYREKPITRPNKLIPALLEKEEEPRRLTFQSLAVSLRTTRFNPLNPELNPICYLLALLGAHYFLHVSRIRVKSSTFRLLMSYIYIYIYIYIWSTHS